MGQSDQPNVDRHHEQDRQWVEGLLRKAQHESFYGRLTVELKRGFIDVVLKEESLKSPRKHG